MANALTRTYSGVCSCTVLQERCVGEIEDDHDTKSVEIPEQISSVSGQFRCCTVTVDDDTKTGVSLPSCECL